MALQDESTPDYAGMCNLCGGAVRYPLPWLATGEPADLREALVCPHCQLNARKRAALGLLCERVPTATARVHLTEQASFAYVWLKRHRRNATGSEFGIEASRADILSNWLRQQGVGEPIACEDVTALGFPDRSLDAIASFDVLEHVPDYRRALAEFGRCLRSGGWLVLTAPFRNGDEATLVRARVRGDGTTEHLLPPEMHVDPLSGGVLCYYHFGWDLLDVLRELGFARAAWRRDWSPAHALFAMWTLVAQR